MEEQEEEGLDQNSCQARCEAGGYARKNMKHCSAQCYAEPYSIHGECSTVHCSFSK